jgi:hypothetical protein
MTGGFGGIGGGMGGGSLLNFFRCFFSFFNRKHYSKHLFSLSIKPSILL